MWIKCENPATNWLRCEECGDERVDFNDNGTANVSEGLANSLVEHHELIVEYTKEEE